MQFLLLYLSICWNASIFEMPLELQKVKLEPSEECR